MTSQPGEPGTSGAAGLPPSGPRGDGVRRRIGVMGGTFDPIHHGHLVAASEAASWFDLDEVCFVPTGRPWQKADREVSPAEHRYLMAVVATASNPRFWVSRVDIDRDGPTYTIDTLRDLSERLPGTDLYFITGADALGDIFSWRDAERLFELAHFVGCTRPGAEVEPATLAEIPAERLTMLEIPALSISSTDVRERQRQGRPVWYLVPDGVVQYVTKHGLYPPLSSSGASPTQTVHMIETSDQPADQPADQEVV